MKYLFVLTVFVLLLLSAVFVAAESSIRQRQERLFDPDGREKYFCGDYKKPLFGYGRRDSPDAKSKANFGRRGGGGVRNLMFNSMIPQGRNPARISHFDSGFKGSKNMDEVVELKSDYTFTRDGQTVFPGGFARIVSQEYKQEVSMPFAEIHIRVVNVPPLAPGEVLSAWLVDEDTGYVLRLGDFMIGLQGSGSFAYEVYHYFTPYDEVRVTREKAYRLDLLPHDVVLSGAIIK